MCIRALRSKRADEIVFHLDRIWTEFGPPEILQTDNGGEFRNAKVEALAAEWNVKIVHGAPRRSQSQGSVERCNQDVENILITFQSYFKTSNWASNLHRFQAMKNNRFHRGIGMTPYEALFGRKMRSLPKLGIFAIADDSSQTQELTPSNSTSPEVENQSHSPSLTPIEPVVNLGIDDELFLQNKGRI